MSVNLAWFSTNLAEAALDEALRGAGKQAPRGLHHFTVRTTARGAVARVDEHDVRPWAQAVSAASGAVTLAVTVFEDHCSLDVFERGAHLLFLEDTAGLGVLLGGDLERAATALGTTAKALRRYHRLLEEDDAADAWAFVEVVDACAKLGTFPEDSFSGASNREVSGALETWAEQPRLPLESAAPAKVPSSLKYKTISDQREAAGWASTWVAVAPKLSLSVVQSLRKHGVRDPLQNARLDWLERCAALVDGSAALAPAVELVEAWLGPDAPGAANQVLTHDEVRTLAALIKKHDASVGAGLLERVRVRPEPESLFADGDFL